jgi:acyl-CoA hydrolase
MEHECPCSHRVTLSELVTPEMANFHGKLFGGALLSLVDKAAYVCATRYCHGYCVTASIDQVSFLAPVEIGELVHIYARVISTGTSSMAVEIKVSAENLGTGAENQVCACFVTMVAIRDDKPVPVPPLDCDSDTARRDRLRARRHRRMAGEYRLRLAALETDVAALDEAALSNALRTEDRD